MKNTFITLSVLTSLFFLFANCKKNATPSAPPVQLTIIPQVMVANVYLIGDTVGVILNEKFSLILESTLAFNNFQVTEYGFNKTEMGRNSWVPFIYAPTGGIYYTYLPNTWFHGFNTTQAVDTIVNGRKCSVNHVNRQVHFVKEFPTTTTQEKSNLMSITTDSVYYTLQLMDAKGNLTDQTVSGKCKVVYKPLSF